MDDFARSYDIAGDRPRANLHRRDSRDDRPNDRFVAPNGRGGASGIFLQPVASIWWQMDGGW